MLNGPPCINKVLPYLPYLEVQKAAAVSFLCKKDFKPFLNLLKDSVFL